MKKLKQKFIEKVEKTAKIKGKSLNIPPNTVITNVKYIVNTEELIVKYQPYLNLWQKFKIYYGIILKK